jgi:hypothetical protein
MTAAISSKNKISIGIKPLWFLFLSITAFYYNPLSTFAGKINR